MAMSTIRTTYPMRRTKLALALTAALALALPSIPAHATIETAEAKAAAADAAAIAREHMFETFGKETLPNGQFLWKNGRGAGEVTRVVISLTDQRAYAYRNDELIAVSTISSGEEKHPTPTGIFPILEKKRFHRSIKYDNAPMPFMQRLDSYGIAMHGGHLPGHPASHGCVRLPHQFASKLFVATKVGTEVLIGE
jgi:lipoprotein-anchoring transpeptidase ErfK/SrfK